MSTFHDFYRDRRVLVTGDTGFKGSWLCEWLVALGAEVRGIGLPPDTEWALFSGLGLDDRIAHSVVDVRDSAALGETVVAFDPEVIFHLAAQSLVRRSYAEPIATVATNVMGVAHLLHAAAELDDLRPRDRVVVVVTSDKAYRNPEDRWALVESDPMGGNDLYSASKGAAELIVAAWRHSFFPPGSRLRIATARAGNVIGGGDWAEHRIVPDAMRSLLRGGAIEVRNPGSVRPWQHVLEPLSGYLHLAAAMASDAKMSDAWNFGPPPESTITVGDLCDRILVAWGSGSWMPSGDSDDLHEATHLALSADKAHTQLGWLPVWSLDTSVAATVDWYRAVAEGTPAREPTLRQIGRYQEDAASRGVAWAEVGS